jgi:hypothetical protein
MNIPFLEGKDLCSSQKQKKHHVSHICLIEYDQHTPRIGIALCRITKTFIETYHILLLNGVVERLDEPSNWRACWFAVQNTSQMPRA